MTDEERNCSANKCDCWGQDTPVCHHRRDVTMTELQPLLLSCCCCAGSVCDCTAQCSEPCVATVGDFNQHTLRPCPSGGGRLLAPTSLLSLASRFRSSRANRSNAEILAELSLSQWSCSFRRRHADMVRIAALLNGQTN